MNVFFVLLLALAGDDLDLPEILPPVTGGIPGHPNQPTQPPEAPPVKAPDPLPVPPKVAETLTPQLNQIIGGSLQAVDTARQTIAREVESGHIDRALGQQLDNAVTRMAAQSHTVQQTRQRRIDHEIGADLSELKEVRRKMGEATGKPTGDATSAMTHEAWHEGRQKSGTVADSGTAPVDIGTRFFQGAPKSMDSAGPRLQIYKSLDRTYVPPPKSNQPQTSFTPKGVKILIDDAVLTRVLKEQGLDAGFEELEALEDSVLGAQNAKEAYEKIQAFTEAKQRAFLESTKFRNIEHIQLVSLKELLAKVAPYRDRWNERPADLRTVSGLTRIYGFARSADDVTLVGRVEPGAPAIDLDALIVGLRTVWRDGLTPGCSLDPDPTNPSGSQYSRILGVPEDSSFAKIMLDADYAMKKIMAKTKDEELDIPGYRTLVDCIFETHTLNFNSRFWLFPVQPTAREIQLGPDGRSTLFEARVQVLTEEMAISGRGLVGTGTVSPACALAAQSFTEYYPQIAERRPIFKSLRGLFDIVLLSKLLRHLSPSDSILQELVALPYERVAVPKTYEGVTVTHNREGAVVSLSGGCDMRTRAGSRTLMQAPSKSFDALAQGNLTTLALPESEAATAAPEELAFSAGMQLLTEGKFEEAREKFSQAIDANDANAGAWALRGVARFRLGETQDALWDIVMATRLDPRDLSLRVIYYGLLVELGTPNALDGVGEPIRKELYAQYLARAAHSMMAFKPDEALRDCTRALEAWDRDPKAFAVRAAIQLFRRELKGAEADATRAIDADPNEPRGLYTRSVVRLFREDYQGAVADLDRVIAIREQADFVGQRALVKSLAGDFSGAKADSLRAIQLNPHSNLLFQIPMFIQIFRNIGIDRARHVMGEVLRMPPEYLIKFSRAQEESRGGNLLIALDLMEQAQSILQQRDVKGDVARAQFELTFMTLLGDVAGHTQSMKQEARTRIDALCDGLRARHPDWVSPLLSRAFALKSMGETEEALKAMDVCLASDPSKDLMMEMVFGVVDPAEFKTLVLIMKLGALWERRDQDIAAVIRILDQMTELTSGSRSKHACLGMREIFAAFKNNPSGLDRDIILPDDILTRVREHVTQLAASHEPPRDIDAMTIALFYMLAAAAETHEQSPDRLEAVAKGFFSLRVANDFMPFAGQLPLMRAKLCQMLLGIYRAQLRPKLEKIGRPDGSIDPNVGAAELRACFSDLRARAERIGEPALVYLMAEVGRIAVQDHYVQCYERRLQRLQSLMEVSPNPESFNEDLAKTKKDLERAQGNDAPVIVAGIREAYATAKTLMQVRTIGAVLQFISEIAPARTRPLYRPPEDTQGLQIGMMFDSPLQAAEATPLAKTGAGTSSAPWIFLCVLAVSTVMISVIVVRRHR